VALKAGPNKKKIKGDLGGGNHPRHEQRWDMKVKEGRQKCVTKTKVLINGVAGEENRALQIRQPPRRGRILEVNFSRGAVSKYKRNLKGKKVDARWQTWVGGP